MKQASSSPRNGGSQVTAHTTEYDCNAFYFYFLSDDCNADAYAYPVIKSYPQFQNCGYPTVNVMIKEKKIKKTE